MGVNGCIKKARHSFLHTVFRQIFDEGIFSLILPKITHFAQNSLDTFLVLTNCSDPNFLGRENVSKPLCKTECVLQKIKFLFFCIIKISQYQVTDHKKVNYNCVLQEQAFPQTQIASLLLILLYHTVSSFFGCTSSLLTIVSEISWEWFSWGSFFSTFGHSATFSRWIFTKLFIFNKFMRPHTCLDLSEVSIKKIASCAFCVKRFSSKMLTFLLTFNVVSSGLTMWSAERDGFLIGIPSRMHIPFV